MLFDTQWSSCHTAYFIINNYTLRCESKFAKYRKCKVSNCVIKTEIISSFIKYLRNHVAFRIFFMCRIFSKRFLCVQLLFCQYHKFKFFFLFSASFWHSSCHESWINVYFLKHAEQKSKILRKEILSRQCHTPSAGCNALPVPILFTV